MEPWQKPFLKEMEDGQSGPNNSPNRLQKRGTANNAHTRRNMATTHNTQKRWRKIDNLLIPKQLRDIRRNSQVQTVFREHPSFELWFTRPFEMRELQNTILHLKNKETGKDGIPAEIYKMFCKKLPTFILNLTNAILHEKPTT